MKHIDKILLLPHPGAEDRDLIQRVADLALKNQAEVKVFHVIGGYPKDLREWSNVRDAEQLRCAILEEKEPVLKHTVELLKARGVERISWAIEWGTMYLEVVREVLKNRYDLVINSVLPTSRGNSRFSRRGFLSPSMDLFAHCPCAVWEAKVMSGPRSRRIVAAVGGQGGHVDCGPLNQKILRYAADVADADGSELHIVHAFAAEGTKEQGEDGPRQELTVQLEILHKDMEEKCASLFVDYKTSPKRQQVHLLLGDPTMVIPAFARQQDVDLIVMGTISHHDVPGLSLGTTAEQVLERVNCGILAVKPDDFVSTVTLV